MYIRGMGNLIPASERAIMEQAMQDQFETFWRGFTVYLQAQTAVISTSPTYSRFGDHSQNAAITAQNVAVTPQPVVISGCILYGNKQPWLYMHPDGAQQLKLREADGQVRIKVMADGHTILSQAKLVNLDGIDFTMDSTVRPHGLLGVPTRWTYSMSVTQ